MTMCEPAPTEIQLTKFDTLGLDDLVMELDKLDVDDIDNVIAFIVSKQAAGIEASKIRIALEVQSVLTRVTARAILKHVKDSYRDPNWNYKQHVAAIAKLFRAVNYVERDTLEYSWYLYQFKSHVLAILEERYQMSDYILRNIRDEVYCCKRDLQSKLGRALHRHEMV